MARPRPSPVLVGLTLGVLAGAAWTLLRVQPLARELLAAQQRRAALKGAIATAPPPFDGASLQDEVEALRAERARLEARNEAHARRVAPDALVPDLEHRVAALARDAGLRLESQEALTGPGASPRDRRWTLSGSFKGLWTFIASLERLPARVVLRDLQVTSRAAAARAAGQPPRPPAAPGEPPLQVIVTVSP